MTVTWSKINKTGNKNNFIQKKQKNNNMDWLVKRNGNRTPYQLKFLSTNIVLFNQHNIGAPGKGSSSRLWSTWVQSCSLSIFDQYIMFEVFLIFFLLHSPHPPPQFYYMSTGELHSNKSSSNFLGLWPFMKTLFQVVSSFQYTHNISCCDFSHNE